MRNSSQRLPLTVHLGVYFLFFGLMRRESPYFYLLYIQIRRGWFTELSLLVCFSFISDVTVLVDVLVNPYSEFLIGKSPESDAYRKFVVWCGLVVHVNEISSSFSVRRKKSLERWSERKQIAILVAENLAVIFPLAMSECTEFTNLIVLLDCMEPDLN